MKIISWNVNSIRARLQHILELLNEEKPSLLCLQETKIVDDQFPIKHFSDLGYHSYFSGVPSYNGVAILSKKKLKDVKRHNFCDKSDARFISAKEKNIEYINVYVPAGGDIPDAKLNEKFQHKLNFLKELDILLREKRSIIVCGDLNIAPLEDDVWSHKSLVNVVSHTDLEREKLKSILINCKLTDSIRYFLKPPKNVFTWWSYRSPNFEKNNRGRRLDHILTSESMSKNYKAAKILKEYRKKRRPSDHVPVCLEIEI